MIIRNKIGVRLDSEEIRLAVSLTTSDVRLMVQEYYNRAGLMPITEDDMRYFFERINPILAFSESWRKKMSEWAWRSAIRNGFIVPSNTDGEFFVSARNTLKRSGGLQKGCVVGM